jgi:sensor histidine kinase regulating citrate/malate metabolism
MTPLGFPRPVTVCIDEARYWQGLGRQEMDFHQVLGELVDNSISASGFDKDGDLLPFTVEITIQRIGNKVRVKVADEGTGMSLSDLEKNVISPGGKGSAEGPLNEHGFGLKNALCMLSLGNERPFKIQTRDKKAVRQGHYYLVDSPFSSGMLIKLVYCFVNSLTYD